MKKRNQILMILLFIIPLIFLGCKEEQKELTEQDVQEIEIIFSDVLNDISRIVPVYYVMPPTINKYSVTYEIKMPDYLDFSYLYTISTIIQFKYNYNITKFWTKINNDSYLMEFTYDRFLCKIVYNNNDKIICIEFTLK